MRLDTKALDADCYEPRIADRLGLDQGDAMSCK